MDENAYIAEHYGKMTVREMAEHLGLSKSTVHRRIVGLGLTGGDVTIQVGEVREARHALKQLDRDADTMARLVEVRDMTREHIADAEGSTFARLVSEYRAILKDIHEMEEVEDAGGGGSTKLADIFASFSEE